MNYKGNQDKLIQRSNSMRFKALTPKGVCMTHNSQWNFLYKQCLLARRTNDADKCTRKISARNEVKNK